MSNKLTRYSVTLGLTLHGEDSHGELGLNRCALQNTLSALRRGTGSLKLSTDAFRLGSGKVILKMWHLNLNPQLIILDSNCKEIPQIINFLWWLEIDLLLLDFLRMTCHRENAVCTCVSPRLCSPSVVGSLFSWVSDEMVIFGYPDHSHKLIGFLPSWASL